MITDILIKPISGEFDPRVITDRLAETPYVARDEVDGNTYMMCDKVEDPRKALVERRADPSPFPMIAILIKVNPDSCRSIDARDRAVVLSTKAEKLRPTQGTMTTLAEYHRAQIQDYLDHELTPEELEEVTSLDALSEKQLAVLKILARNQLLAALNYLRAIVPDVPTPTLMGFISQYS